MSMSWANYDVYKADRKNLKKELKEVLAKKKKFFAELTGWEDLLRPLIGGDCNAVYSDDGVVPAFVTDQKIETDFAVFDSMFEGKFFYRIPFNIGRKRNVKGDSLRAEAAKIKAYKESKELCAACGVGGTKKCVVIPKNGQMCMLTVFAVATKKHVFICIPKAAEAETSEQKVEHPAFHRITKEAAMVDFAKAGLE